jgi:hypothetical protein
LVLVTIIPLFFWTKMEEHIFRNMATHEDFEARNEIQCDELLVRTLHKSDIAIFGVANIWCCKMQSNLEETSCSI